MDEREYKSIRKLGEGGMGEVWLVMEIRSRGLYARKMLHPSLAREKDLVRFEREIKALRALDHQNIIRVHDVERTDSSLSYVMEYCPDGNLLQFLERKPQDRIVPFIIQLADAVAHLHENGLIHRDVKPQNVLVGVDGDIRLTDFGLVVQAGADRSIVTTSNWVSPGFSPPEQYRDMASVTPKGDIYSIAALWFFLIRKHAFDFDAPADPQLEELNPLERFVMRGSLVREPSARFESARIIRDTLREASMCGLLEFFDLGVQERIERVQQRFDECHAQEGWFDGWDIGEMSAAMSFLETMLKYEDNELVRESAQSHLNTLDGEARRIAAEMEQDNPWY